MNLRSYFGAIRRIILCSLYRRPIELGGTGPVISFSFDDFPRTAYSVAGAILEKYGVRGTYYVASGLMNKIDHLGEQFHADDLHALRDGGHDLGSQTFSHISSRSASCAAFREDVQRGREVLEKLTGVDGGNFAYPYGHVTLKTKRILGPALTSSRSIIPGFNGPEVDLNLLKANRLYGGLDQSRYAEGLILENAKRKTWLIFYTHDVCPEPSIYGCTPALFEATVSAAVRSGSRILTIQQVLSERGVQAWNRKGQFCLAGVR